MVQETRLQEKNPSLSQKPWWNRPLMGDMSLLERINKSFTRKQVLLEAIELHDVTFKQLQQLSERMYFLDNDKFGNKEFLAFVRISRKLENSEGEYDNLKMPTALLRAGLTTHLSFTKLEQTEFAHRGFKFNEFYDYVDQLCFKRVSPDVFCHDVKVKITEISPTFKSHEGRAALRQYAAHLLKIGHQQSSLDLLCAFKRLQFHCYAIFQDVADALNQLNRSDLLNLDLLSTHVIHHFESFETLGTLIELSPEQHTLPTYTCLFQYLALSERHARAYEQFGSLASQFQLWQELRQKALTIRQRYPISEYRVPRQFLVRIPGTRIYNKYAPYLDV